MISFSTTELNSSSWANRNKYHERSDYNVLLDVMTYNLPTLWSCVQIDSLLHLSFSRQNNWDVTILTVDWVLKFHASTFSSATRNRTSGYTNNNQHSGPTDCFHMCVLSSHTHKALVSFAPGLVVMESQNTGPSCKVHSKFLAKFKPKGLKNEDIYFLSCFR